MAVCVTLPSVPSSKKISLVYFSASPRCCRMTRHPQSLFPYSDIPDLLCFASNDRSCVRCSESDTKRDDRRIHAADIVCPKCVGRWINYNIISSGIDLRYRYAIAFRRHVLATHNDTKLCIECLFGLSLWRSKGLFSSSGFLKKTLCRHPNVRAFIKVPCSFIIS